MVVCLWQLYLGVDVALYNKKLNEMNTKSIHAEILYCISPFTQMSSSFKAYGTEGKDCKQLLMVMAYNSKCIHHHHQLTDKLLAHMPAQCAPLDDLRNLTNLSLLKKQLKITEEEAGLPGGIESAVINRVATKCILK
eukprot:GHVQ01042248.1.p1 GENE.GHVQ01042248.1~~GHVQ01042248.1.p1  ORF type:complete len:137 (-),score=19.70 GHVQ01042248.1:96-506(-)